MRKRRHLFLALSRKGWGETSLSVQIAQQLIEAGESVSFIAHTESLLALAGLNSQVIEVSDETGPAIEDVFDRCLSNDGYDSFVLCDYLITDDGMLRFGVDPESIFRYNVPIVALDTWEYETTGKVVDLWGFFNFEIGTWIERIPHRLTPVPFGHLTTSSAYCSLPSPANISRETRKATRANLGLKDDDKVVLFCSAIWQHKHKDTGDMEFGVTIPQLLLSYLKQVDPTVKLVHVGPSALSIDPVDGRYMWMPPMCPADFNKLLASVDLVLSLNISATTIGLAMVTGIPVIVIHNSYSAPTREEMDALIAGSMSSTNRNLLVKSLPLFPFAMWPLGNAKFLAPLLKDNNYTSVLQRIELIDEPGFVQACRLLLFDAAAREAMRNRQEAYVNSVRKLPTAVQLLDSYLR